MNKLLVISGSGSYPRLIVEGAKKAGVEMVDIISIKGSTWKETRKAADHDFPFSVYDVLKGITFAAENKYEGAILAGQVNPMSLFRGRFDDTARKWLRAMPVKNAHSIFGKLVEEFEKAGVRMLPASSYMDDNMPGVGVLTKRGFTGLEERDIKRAIEVAADMGRHDVGQTVLVKSGMVFAVEAFEGTNAAIKRAGKLGKGTVLFKAAREGHDMRFDIPVVGLGTLKNMKKAGVTALGFQAGRLVLLDKEDVIKFADKHNIAIVGIDSGLPAAPLRP